MIVGRFEGIMTVKELIEKYKNMQEGNQNFINCYLTLPKGKGKLNKYDESVKVYLEYQNELYKLVVKDLEKLD